MKIAQPLIGSALHLGGLAAPQPATRSVLGWGFSAPPGVGFTPKDFPGYWTLHLAEMSKAVYGPELDVRKRLVFAGNLMHLRWFDIGSTQAVGYFHEGHACLVFRGTQEREDWFVDVNIVQCSSPGRHLGFHRAWLLVQPQVNMWLGQIRAALHPLTSNMGFAQKQDVSLVVAGHSLGGALAILAAWELSADNTIAAVRTFGAPRIGSPEFAIGYRRRLASVTLQFRHENDLVPIVPPPLLFQHVTFPLTISGPPGIADDQPRGVLAALVSGISLGPLAQLPTRAINKDPLIALLLTAVCLLALSTTLVSASILWVHRFMHLLLSTRPGFGILFFLAVVVCQQVSFAIPARIPPVARWLLALAAIGTLCVVHTSLLLLVQVFIWTSVVLLFVLRQITPSATDHFMDNYLTAFSRPWRMDPAYLPFNPNARLYEMLGLLAAFPKPAAAPTTPPPPAPAASTSAAPAQGTPAESTSSVPPAAASPAPPGSPS